MSIELTAAIDGTGDFSSAIARALRDDPTFEVISMPESSAIKLRFPDNPRRDHWPEDVVVTFGPRQISVVVHYATRQQRAYLVRLLERIVVEAGCSGMLVEE